MDAAVYSKLNNMKAELDSLKAQVTALSSAGVLSELTLSATVPAGGSYKTDLATGCNKYRLQLMYLENDTNGSPLYVKVYNSGGASPFVEYQSNYMSLLRDIIDLPIIDKDSKQQFHVEVFNTGSQPANVFMRARILSSN